MQPGTTLGPYRIEAEIGSGGMGTVHAAVVVEAVAGLAPGQRVALKLLHPHLVGSEGFLERFRREAEFGRAVESPNVVRTFDCLAVDVDGTRREILVMEHVQGQTLRDLLAELERVPEELCRHIGREVCRGLAAIHAAGIVHRDVKPENIIISLSEAKPGDDVAERPSARGSRDAANRGHNVQPRYDHVVKVMDLGIARLTDEAIRLSQTGAFVGSLHYAAPEQFRGGGEDVDGRADLHALGLVLYELASSVSPYAAADVAGAIRKVLHESPRRLGEVNPQLSPFFEEAVHTLLAKEREERFGDAPELLGVLEQGEESDWWRDRARSIRAATKRPIRRIRIPRETQVHGRERELTKLRELYDQAQSGDGQVVLIVGEAGIGKSRLVDELLGRLQRDGEDLDFLFGSYPPGGAATAEGAFSTAYREQFGDAGSEAYLRETPRLVPGFDALLRGDAQPPGSQPLNKQSLQTCFVHATRALAATRPTVVLIDDLHFAPEEGQALFSALAMSVAGHRVLLIGTARPGVSEAWVSGVTRHDHVTQLGLDRLGPKDLVELLTDALRSPELATRLAGQIGLKSDGNPFFVFEIVRGMREGHYLTQTEDGSWISTQEIQEIMIPSSVLDLVNARVAELDEGERDLVDAAACCGFEFDPSIVAAALGAPVLPTLKRLAQIERRHRLVRSVGRHMVFDHHQIQESLYGGLMEQIREHYHAAIADVLEQRATRNGGEVDASTALDLCRHFLRGGSAARSVPYILAALGHLAASHLHAAVADLAGLALEAPGVLTGTLRLDVVLRLEVSLAQLGRADAQRAAIDEALALATALDDAARGAQAQRRLGALLLRVGESVEAERVLMAALAAARSVGDRSLEGGILTNLGNLCRFGGRLDEAREFHELSLAVARDIGARDGEMHCLGNLGTVAWNRGRNDEAQQIYEQSIAIARELGDAYGESIAVGNLALVMSALGRIDEAQRLIGRQAELSRAIGSRTGEAFAVGNLGTTFNSRGQTARAQEHYERSIALCQEIELPRLEAIMRLNIGEALLQQGATDAAADDLGAALALARRVGARDVEGVVLAGLAEVARRRGDEPESERSLRAAIDLYRELAVRDSHAAAALLELADLLASLDRTDEAHGLLADALEIGRECGSPDVLVLAPLYDALHCGADPAAASAAHEQHAGDMKAGPRMNAHWLLFRITGDREHLAEASRLLDDAVSHATADLRESMIENVPLHRDITSAAAGAE